MKISRTKKKKRSRNSLYLLLIYLMAHKLEELLRWSGMWHITEDSIYTILNVKLIGIFAWFVIETLLFILDIAMIISVLQENWGGTVEDSMDCVFFIQKRHNKCTYIYSYCVCKRGSSKKKRELVAVCCRWK